MKKLILGVSAAALLSSQPGFSKDIQRFIVKFKPSVGLQSVRSLSSKLGLKVESKQAMAAGLTILTIDGDKSVYSALKSHPSIEYAIIDKQKALLSLAQDTIEETLHSADLDNYRKSLIALKYLQICKEKELFKIGILKNFYRSSV